MIDLSVRVPDLEGRTPRQNGTLMVISAYIKFGRP
ncbi:uncharacterized protein METZ01_LOCUS355547, partial [marine metagenome]